jgi:hypothetical protein
MVASDVDGQTMTTPPQGGQTDSSIGVNLDALAPGSRIDVETKSRHYYIECLGGNSVRISGHPEYCPEPTPAKIHGSIDKEGVLECGHIGRGMKLMFFVEDNRPVTTSRVVSFRVDRPTAASPGSAISIH